MVTVGTFPELVSWWRHKHVTRAHTFSFSLFSLKPGLKYTSQIWEVNTEQYNRCSATSSVDVILTAKRRWGRAVCKRLAEPRPPCSRRSWRARAAAVERRCPKRSASSVAAVAVHLLRNSRAHLPPLRNSPRAHLPRFPWWTWDSTTPGNFCLENTQNFFIILIKNAESWYCTRGRGVIGL